MSSHQTYGGANLGVSGEALTAADVTTVTVTVTSNVNPTLTPIVQNLADTEQGWTGVIGGLWVGSDHFAVAAQNSAGTTVYSGATDALIQEGQITQILITLQQSSPSTAFTESAPVITSVTASSNAVGPGDVVNLTAAATDATAGTTLTYQWTANGGTFTNGGAGTATSWTAPSTQQNYTIEVTVTDSSGATATVSLGISDESTNAKGSASFGVAFNTWPVVNTITATPDALVAGQSTTLSVTATDAENNPLTYSWSDNCGGTFASSSGQTPSWTAPAVAPGSGFCTLSVTASDGVGGSGTGSITLPIGPAIAPNVAPVFGVEFEDTGAPFVGQTVHFIARATDPQGSPLTFTWAYSPTDPNSTLGTAVSTANESDNTFIPGSPESYTVTVTATDALGLSTSYSWGVVPASYSVTPSSDGNESVTPGAQIVNVGLTQAFTVTANTGYTVSPTVGGTCPAGSWAGSVYTTGAITANCTVTFGAVLESFGVSASGDGYESIAPASESANYDSTASFIVTASTGYTLSSSVGGTCAAGSFSGSTYTTGVITGPCTVTFSATLNSYTVSATGDGSESISPSSQSASYGSTASFTVTASTGYTLSGSAGGTCPAGSFSGSTYTTGTITGACTVTFGATLNAFTVSAGGDGNESISPSSQSAHYGSTASFTVTASSGYTLASSAGGTCPAGFFSGSTYTTGAIYGTCTVTFSATQNMSAGAPATSLGSFALGSEVWDCQRNPAYPSAGQEVTYSGLAPPLDSVTFSEISYTPGEVIEFGYAGGSCTQDDTGAANNVVESLYNASGNFVEVVSTSGGIWGITSGVGFLYVATETGFGTFFSATPESQDGSVSFTAATGAASCSDLASFFQ